MQCRRVRQLVGLRQAPHQVVRVQDRAPAHLGQALRPEREDVRAARARRTPKLPWNECTRPIDCGRSQSRRMRPSACRTATGAGRNGSRCSATATGPRARAAAAVRRRERLVQVDVHDVEAEVARAHAARPARSGSRRPCSTAPRPRAPAASPRARAARTARACSGTREHHGGGAVVERGLAAPRGPRVASAAEGIDHGLVADQVDAGRVRAVRRVGHDHAVALLALAARAVPGADEQQAGQLARARRRPAGWSPRRSR